MVLQYTHLEAASPYGLKEILIHRSIVVLNENPDGIKARGEKGQGFALELGGLRTLPSFILVLQFSLRFKILHPCVLGTCLCCVVSVNEYEFCSIVKLRWTLYLLLKHRSAVRLCGSRK